MRDPKLEFNDEHWIDALVDGELDETSRRDLLLRLDARPELWRRCALAFLEAQSWSSALRESPAAMTVVAAPVVRQPSRLRTVWRPLLAAASVLVAFGCGLWWGTSSGDRTQLAVNRASSSVQPTEPVQLYEAASLDEAALAQLPPALSPEMVQMLESLGAQVRQQRRFVPFELEDGRRGVLPLDEIAVQPVSRRSYQ